LKYGILGTRIIPLDFLKISCQAVSNVSFLKKNVKIFLKLFVISKICATFALANGKEQGSNLNVTGY
jgi:hypothetical protein